MRLPLLFPPTIMAAINSSPPSKNLRSHTAQSVENACGRVKLEVFRQNMVKEAAGKVIALSVEKFIKLLLPLPDDDTSKPAVPSNIFADLSGGKKLVENDIAEKWVSGPTWLDMVRAETNANDALPRTYRETL